MNDINAQIQQAREAAGNSAQQVANTSAPAPAAAQALAPAPAMSSPSLDDFTEGSMAVDRFVKVNEFGLVFDKDSDELVKKAKVRISMQDVVPHLAIKANSGDQVKYWKSYDGVTTTDGIPWQEAIRQANQFQAGDKAVEPYKTADIPMVLLEDVKDGDKNVIAPAGETAGYSLSTTNRREFQDFLRALDKAGLDRGSAVVEVEISSKKRTSDKYTWGVMAFDLLGAA